jgi:hypothetical protein
MGLAGAGRPDQAGVFRSPAPFERGEVVKGHFGHRRRRHVEFVDGLRDREGMPAADELVKTRVEDLVSRD